MSEVTVVVLFAARPGRGDDAEAALREVSGPTHAEEGCILFAAHRVAGDPDRLVLVERWADRDALDRHLASPHLLAFREGAADVWAAPPEILLVEPLRAGDPVKGALAGAA
jgi:quinol monooxygenase YgiN